MTPVTLKRAHRAMAWTLLAAALISSGCQLNRNKRPAALPPAAQTALKAVPSQLPIDPATVKGGAQRAQRDAERQQQPEVLRYSTHPWIAAAPMPMREEQRLPDVFYQPFALNYAMEDTGISLDMLALRVSQITRLPVRVLPDVYVGVDKSVAIDESEALEEEERVRQEAAKQAQGQRRTGARNKRYEVQEIPPHLLRWRGNLRGFLNHLTDRLDLSWTYEDGTVVLSRFQTEAFELALFPTKGRYSLRTLSTGSSGRGSSAGGAAGSSSVSGANTGSVGGTQTIDFNEQGQIDAYESTIALIENLVATVPGSQVYVTQGSGRILVRSSRLMLRTLREIIRSENASLMRQVLVQVDIYNVTHSSKRQFAVDWSVIYQRMFPGVDVGLGASGATGGVGIFNFPDSRLRLLEGKIPETSVAGAPRNMQALVSALGELGYNVQHRPLNIMAMNRQWVRKAKLFSQSYLAETTAATANALGGGAGVPGLKAATITVGDQIMLMPFVLENNSVMLKFTVSFSDLLGLDKIETGEGLTRQLLQIPTTSTVQDNFTVSIKPGELVAITGLGNQTSNQNRRSIGPDISPMLGGSEVDENRNQHFLVFLRVVLL